MFAVGYRAALLAVAAVLLAAVDCVFGDFDDFGAAGSIVVGADCLDVGYNADSVDVGS